MRIIKGGAILIDSRRLIRKVEIKFCKELIKL